jgi:hypothetical protein
MAQQCLPNDVLGTASRRKIRDWWQAFDDGGRMSPRALIDRLVALFPDFRAYWDDTENCYRDDDGSFTLHGVFAEFTSFYRERHARLPADRVAALGAFVSECMAPGDDGPLSNAAATCFVENIVGEPCDRNLSPHLSGEAKRYWLAWGGRA